MTSHGFIGGKRSSNEDEIAKAVFDAGEKVGAKKITIHFFEKSDNPEYPINTLVEFDCHNLDGTANLTRVQNLARALKKDVSKVKWGDPLILGARGYSKF